MSGRDPDGLQGEIDTAYLLETFLENTPDHVYFKDADGRFTQLSASLARWIGVERIEHALGGTDFDFFGASHAESARAAELEVMRTGEPMVGVEECEVWPDGRVSWVSTTKAPLRSRDGLVIGTFGLSRDITARKLAEQRALEQSSELERLASQLEALTLHDELTGLYNRRGLDLLGAGAVQRAARDGAAICVLFVDVDGLKAINDGLGHAAGDRALIAAATILVDAVRQTDVVGRIGGDEFAAVLVGTSAPEAEQLCARVRAAAGSHAPDGLPLSMSIGVATADAGEVVTLDALMDAADRAMYEGRGRPSGGQRLITR